MGDRTLDPPDWEAFRATGHRMLDDMMDFLRDVRERPAWQPVSSAARERLALPLPVGPTPLERGLRGFSPGRPALRDGQHPPGLRRLGARQRDPDGDARRAPGGGDELERRRPRARGGLRGAAGDRLVPRALRVSRGGERRARHRHLDGQPHRGGGGADRAPRPRGARGRPRLRCARPAADGLRRAIGARVRRQGDGDRRASDRAPSGCSPPTATAALDLAALREAIAADRRSGATPFLVVGTAGTVDTGAIDDLQGLAAIAAAEGVWFHVDGAFGALAMMSPELAPRLAGIERADSHRLRLPQVGARALRRRLRAGARRGPAPRGLRHRAALPGALQSGHRRGAALVRRLRPRPVARVPRAQGVVHLAGARHRGAGRGDAGRTAARPRPWPPRSTPPPIWSGWPRSASTSSASATAPPAGSIAARPPPGRAGLCPYPGVADEVLDRLNRDRRRHAGERHRRALEHHPRRAAGDPGEPHQPPDDDGRPRAPARLRAGARGRARDPDG